MASLENGQSADTVIFDNAFDGQPHYPAGNYTLLYDGEGIIEPHPMVRNDVRVIEQTLGKKVLNVVPTTTGIWLRLSETKLSNPVRNIRLLMPGFESTYQTQPFHPLFLERLKPFTTVRFMDWMRTNNSIVRKWQDRPDAKLCDARRRERRGTRIYD